MLLICTFCFGPLAVSFIFFTENLSKFLKFLYVKILAQTIKHFSQKRDPNTEKYDPNTGFHGTHVDQSESGIVNEQSLTESINRTIRTIKSLYQNN